MEWSGVEWSGGYRSPSTFHNIGLGLYEEFIMKFSKFIRFSHQLFFCVNVKVPFSK